MLKNFLRKVSADYGSGQKFADTTRYDPYKSFRFEVSITATGTNGTTFGKAGFQKISALKGDIDVIEYREGGDSIAVLKTPGLVKYEPITFTRGMSEDVDVWNWFEQCCKNNSGFRATISIKLKDRDNVAIAKEWTVSDAWISSYTTGDFDAQGNAVMIESMTVQSEGFVKKS